MTRDAITLSNGGTGVNTALGAIRRVSARIIRVLRPEHRPRPGTAGGSGGWTPALRLVGHRSAKELAGADQFGRGGREPAGRKPAARQQFWKRDRIHELQRVPCEDHGSGEP